MHLSSASDGRPRKLLDRLAPVPGPVPVTRGPCGGCWLVGRFIFKVILLSRLRERERGSVRPFALYTSSDVSTPLRPSKQHCLDVSYVHFTSLYFGCIVRTLGSGRAPHAAYARARSRSIRRGTLPSLTRLDIKHGYTLDLGGHLNRAKEKMLLLKGVHVTFNSHKWSRA